MKSRTKSSSNGAKKSTKSESESSRAAKKWFEKRLLAKNAQLKTNLPHEWEQEDDFYSFEHNGLPCYIIRNSQLGHLCGYVGVPKTHPLHGMSYSNDIFLRDATVEQILDVHGGITFSDDHLPNGTRTGHWFFGFDCAHCGDLSPHMLLRTDNNNRGEVYRPVSYVWKECERLAEQLHRLGSEDIASQSVIQRMLRGRYEH